MRPFESFTVQQTGKLENAVGFWPASDVNRVWRRMMISSRPRGQAPACSALCGENFAPCWCSKLFRAPSPAVSSAAHFPNHLIARIPMLGMFVAMHCGRQVEDRMGPRRSPSDTRALPSITQGKGSAVKRKLISVLVSLAFGWLTTAAMAEEDTTAASADSSADTSEPAAPADQSTDAASVDTSTSDGTIAASPAETDAK